ncbi:MAG: hypothetical protein WC107_07340 [Patescibacteria group bacterium]
MWGEVEATTVPAAAPIRWGARGIKERDYIDLLPDRTEMQYIDDNGAIVGKCPEKLNKRKKAFISWHVKAFRKINRWSAGVPASSDKVFSIDDGKLGFHARATCAASYGYVYTTAWADAKEDYMK